MIKGEEFKPEGYDKVLVPASQYDSNKDIRLLIPFTNGRRIGFMNKDNIVVVPPEYSAYYGDCCNEKDYIVVEKTATGRVPYNRSNGFPYLQGLINYKGEVVYPCEYTHILPAYSTENHIFTVEYPQKGWAVVNAYGEKIVSFGEYQEISGYTQGFARVKKNGKYGIIDEAGEVIVPIEYNTIWNFYMKDWYATQLAKEDKKYNFWLKDKRVTPFD